MEEILGLRRELGRPHPRCTSVTLLTEAWAPPNKSATPNVFTYNLAFMSHNGPEQ